MNASGLNEAAKKAPNPEMRHLAAIAANAYSQEQLARIYNARFHRSLNGGNVSAHFWSNAPRRETVNNYADLLGVSQDALDLVAGRGLSPASLQRYRERICSELLVEQEEFFELGFDLAAEVHRLWSLHGESVERHSIEEYAKQELRADEESRKIFKELNGAAPGGAFYLFYTPLKRFLLFMQRYFDFEAHRVEPRDSAYRVLGDIWMATHTHFGEEGAAALVSVARALLISRGEADTISIYDEELERTKNSMKAVHRLRGIQAMEGGE